MAEYVVVDTDVMSFIYKKSPVAERYLPLIENKSLVISFMTVAELEYWAVSRKWGEERRRELGVFLDRLAIYPYDRRLCREWAGVRGVSARLGRPISFADAWIAATAVLCGIPLVSHNARHFRHLEGLTVLTVFAE